MIMNFGLERVLEPKQVIPTSAWRLNNTKAISNKEMRVSLRKIHIEGTSFRQLCLASGDDQEIIKEKIQNIIALRGKLHNPATDTGGLAYGVVEEIGSDYPNSQGLKVGEKVICDTSLTSIPIYIEKISNIDFAYGQIEVEGYAVVYGTIPIVRKPKNIASSLILYIFNESATLQKVGAMSRNKKRFLIVGNNLLTNLMYGYTIKKTVGNSGKIVCLLDKFTNTIIKDGRVDELTQAVFDEILYMDILRPLDCLEKLGTNTDFDFTVNCADIPGAETVNILAAKPKGDVIFSNLINNYNIALYITEAIGKEVNVTCAGGYSEDYWNFDIEIAKELEPYLTGTRVLSRQSRKEEADNIIIGNLDSISTDSLIAESKTMRKVLQDIVNVSKYDCNVMITGETGVGKEKVADVVQKNSKRKMKPFVKINCASISPTLMESEFFGYESGAFTGAKSGGKKGYFELADNGMVFLDEVGELPLEMQAKLLRVIQEGEFYRVGGTKPVKTNVRIISATNRDLEDMVNRNMFRSDLYYRLNVYPINVPSLKERIDDIKPLVNFFLKKYGDRFGVEKTVEPAAADYLETVSWPGNIRELENVTQRLLINSRGAVITVMDVMGELHKNIFENKVSIAANEETDIDMPLDELVSNFEKEIIRRAYEEYGSTRKAAKALRISQTQMVRKKNKYGI